VSVGGFEVRSPVPTAQAREINVYALPSGSFPSHVRARRLVQGRTWKPPVIPWRGMLPRVLGACILLAVLVQLPVQAEEVGPAERAARAARVLQQWYDVEAGTWKTTSWWNAANALTTIIRYTDLTGDPTYRPVISNTFERCKEFVVKGEKPEEDWVCRNFVNAWYDDAGWWVIVWLDAYDLTGEHRYLEMAKLTFADMTQGWDDVCGGGVYWKKPKIGKHTITNGLFLIGAARIHQRSPGELVGGRSHLQWAKDAWRWLRDSKLVNDDHLVENGLNDNCILETGAHYTYNQGVVIAGLLELGRATEDKALIELAGKIASTSMRKLVNQEGVLREFHEPNLTGDSSQFKGVYIRHLATLYKVTGDTEIKAFIERNAQAIWTRARNESTDEIGGLWTGPFDMADAARQSSALDALNAAILVDD
jgi:predicted alpha-1,6-mannanase (GH76 family)